MPLSAVVKLVLYSVFDIRVCTEWHIYVKPTVMYSYKHIQINISGLLTFWSFEVKKPVMHTVWHPSYITRLLVAKHHRHDYHIRNISLYLSMYPTGPQKLKRSGRQMDLYCFTSQKGITIFFKWPKRPCDIWPVLVWIHHSWFDINMSISASVRYIFWVCRISNIECTQIEPRSPAASHSKLMTDRGLL